MKVVALVSFIRLMMKIVDRFFKMKSSKIFLLARGLLLDNFEK